jgi:tape measure domain-containing protein
MPVGANAGLAGLNVNVGVNLQQFNTGMAEIEKRGAQVTQNLNSMGSALTTGAGIGAGVALATAALSGLADIAGVASSAVIGLNSELEQARIGFTAFTGSAEKANAFVKQLQDFAAKTTFEFPGLLQSARQLTGMGVQAELVIPILKDVGTAVMSVGGGDVAVKRVNKALTDMMAAGKVSAQDMMQLANAGIPGWKMLADSMGMTIGQVKELSKQGKITSDQMLQAFHDFANRSGLDTMLEKSSQTWQAATSNIIDGLRNIGAEGFEPLFNVMRDVAVQMANILTSDSAKQFAADLKATVQDLINTAQPLGDVFSRAFEAFKTDGVTGAINSILTDVQNLAQQMGGAGFTLISEFAGGIVSGASSLITEAANYVADIIASYLIGNSPPPVGPLSNIVEGGTAVIAAYVDGLKAGTSGVSDVAQSIVDAFGNVDGAMTLTQGRAALQAAGEDMKALADASTSVEGVLRNLDQQIQDNQSTLRDYQNAATDIKDAFEGAIDPLQRQVDALKEANDLTTKQADLQDRLALAQLKGQLAQAQGDPVQRAKLQTQLDALQEQEKTITLQETQLRLQKQAADLDAKARGQKPNDTATSQRENQLAQQKLGIQQKENGIQQQLNGMVDKEAVARLKSQQTQVQTAKDTRDTNSEVESLQRQLQAAPLEQQIKDLKDQQQALLQPIKDRIEATQREGQALQDQRKHWQDIKGAITDVMQEQRAAAAEAKKDTADAAKTAKEAALSKPSNLAAIFNPQEIVTGAEKVGQSWLTGFNDYLSAHAASLIGGALGAVLGGAAFGPLGAIAGAAFGKSFMERMQQNFGCTAN